MTSQYGIKKPTLEIFGALPLLARLADDLDRARRERANDPFGLIVGRGSHNLHQSLDFLLLLIHIRDEQLLANTAPDIGCAGWWIGDVKRFPRRACPLDRTFLRGRLARDRNNDPRWA